ncbi:hypothetical protein [Natronincola ferrireducens]|uniref:hypothetical protein n=1 Tax=Natronincola ferrireducens TaxID=393762 RepID=UPI000B845140|nr:hypothetical protein [Natronincola ferrireducens]
MKDKETKFIRSWEERRKKGKLKYVLTAAALFETAPLAGTIFGSIVLYNLPTSFLLCLILF